MRLGNRPLRKISGSEPALGILDTTGLELAVGFW